MSSPGSSPSPQPATASEADGDLLNALNLLSLASTPTNNSTTTATSSPSSSSSFIPITVTKSVSSNRAPPPAPISLLAASSAVGAPLSSPASDSQPHSIVSPAPPSRRTCVIFQDECSGHVYTRDGDTAGIVERPERIRAVKMGVSAAWARLEARAKRLGGGTAASVRAGDEKLGLEQLDALMGHLDIAEAAAQQPPQADGSAPRSIAGGPFDILFSTAKLRPDDPALLAIHSLPNVAPPAPPRAPSPPPAPPSTTTTPSRKPPRDRTSPVKRQPTSPTPFSSLAFSDGILGSSDNTPLATPALPTAPPTAMDPNAPWPSQLEQLCRNSTAAQKVAPFSEIPPHMSQTDLYLSPGSEGAIFGALGAVVEGVDRVVQGARSGGEGYDRAFVAIRPPGHHCESSVPMGFCFVNNVAVAAAHAHQEHGIEKVVILDIDLHHGNGTQEIVWRINQAANKLINKANATSPKKSPAKRAPPPRPLKIMYASLHDVYSYPCEDGDQAMVQAASLNLAGGHSQWITNVHLESYDTESAFHERLYHKYQSTMLSNASEFCRAESTGFEDDNDRTLVIVSAGFDASEHESVGMSRHGRRVPTSFFHRFARDVVKFSNTHAGGKVLAVLEGGYSDKALASGAMALLVGLSESPRFLDKTWIAEEGDEGRWWDDKSLARIEKACKHRRGQIKRLGPPSTQALAAVAPPSAADDADAWLARTVEVFAFAEQLELVNELKAVKSVDPPRTMQLRERKPRGTQQAAAAPAAIPPAVEAEALLDTSSSVAVVEKESAPAGANGGVVVEVERSVLVAPAESAASGPKVKFVWREGGVE